jgi:hypothetical protein
MHTGVQSVWAAGMMAAALMIAAESKAQTRCEPTISNPCKPQPNAGANTLNEAPKPRPATRLDPVPAIPDIKVDKDTSMGFGQGGGIFGLERKF